MRKILLVSLALILATACNSPEKDDFRKGDFKSELTSLYYQVQSLHTLTRNNDDPAPYADYETMSEEEAYDLACQIESIYEEYNIVETVQAMGYYTGIATEGDDDGEISMDDLSFLSMILYNGTQDFYRIIDQWFSEKKLDYTLQDILGNENLLPNEQLALTTCISYLTDHLATRGNKNNPLVALAEIGRCKDATAKVLLKNIVFFFVSKKYFIAKFMDTLITEGECIKNAVEQSDEEESGGGNNPCGGNNPGGGETGDGAEHAGGGEDGTGGNGGNGNGDGGEESDGEMGGL